MSDEHERVLNAIALSGSVSKVFVRRVAVPWLEAIPGLEDFKLYMVLHFEPGLVEPQVDVLTLTWDEAMDEANRLASRR